MKCPQDYQCNQADQNVECNSDYYNCIKYHVLRLKNFKKLDRSKLAKLLEINERFI